MCTQNMLMRRISIFVLLLVSINVAFAKTIYVKQGANGNGTSWTNAYGNLQNALDASNSGDQIWVAAGIYKPSVMVGGTTSRHKTFQMKNGVAIYGGFAGNESSLGQRNIDANETVLSGDLNGDDGPNFANRVDNCIRVFYHPSGTNLNATAVLDGFTITAGNASPANEDRGGGMENVSSHPNVANCTFTDNSAALKGGAMNNTYSNPTLINCIFRDNYSKNYGGGMANYGSNPAITNCIFQGNTAEKAPGGGIYNNKNSNPTITNCTFGGNIALKSSGGGMYSYQSTNVTVTNCIFWGNGGLGIDEIYSRNSTVVIANSNIAGCLDGNSWDSLLGIDGGGNMDENPYFDAVLQLQSGSACIDAADGDAAPVTDILGNSRFDDTYTTNIGTGSPNYADMGAYEYQGFPTTSRPALFINSTGTAGVAITSRTGHGGDTGSDYIETVDENTPVSLTAPAVWGLSTFTGWTGSAAEVNTSNLTIWLPTDISQFAMARYETPSVPTYTITVYSNNVSNVPISSSTGHGGVTTYSTDVLEGANNILTAPATWDGKTFTEWIGAVTSSDRTISFSINSSNDTSYLMARYETTTTPTLSYITISGTTQVDENSGSQYTATAYYSDGTSSNVTNSASWSENSSYATISSSGYLSTSSVSSDQSCTITATYGDKSDTHNVTINDAAVTLSSISISGSTQVDENSGAQYTCTAYYSDNSSADVTDSASWDENSSAATISSSGYLTTFSVSSDQLCTVTATYGGKSDTHNVTINDAPATGTTLSVSSSGATGVPITSTTGYGGTTNYTLSTDDGVLVILTAPASWNGATFTGWSGAATTSSTTTWFRMNGSQSVTANYTGGSTPTLSSISISGPTQVDENSGAQYTCTAYYSDGSSSNVTNSASWSENSAYATISSSGYLSTSLVSSDQSCTITATYEDKSDTHSITIIESAGCVPSSVYVDTILADTSRGSRGRSFGYVTVTVVDNCGNAIANADVVGTFTGDYNETLVATTNASGIATFTTSTEIKKPAYTFCVDDIIDGLEYSPSDNVLTCVSY